MFLILTIPLILTNPREMEAEELQGRVIAAKSREVLPPCPSYTLVFFNGS